MSRYGYGLDRANNMMTMGLNALKMNEAVGGLHERQRQTRERKEREDLFGQWQGGGLEINEFQPSSLNQAQFHEEALGYMDRTNTYQERQRLFNESAEVRQLSESAFQKISTEGPEALEASPPKSIPELQARMIAQRGWIESQNLDAKADEARKALLARKHVQYQEDAEVATRLLQQGDEGGRREAAELVRKWSEATNTNVKLVPVDEGRFEEYRMNDDGKFEPTGEIVPLEKAVQSMAATTPREFIAAQIAMANAVKQKNEESALNPMEFVDGSNNAYEVVLRVDPDDPDNQEARVFRQGGGYMGSFPSLDAARNQFGLVRTGTAKGAADVGTTRAQERQRNADARNKDARTAEIGREGQGGSGQGGPAGNVSLSEQRQSAAQAVRIVGGLTRRPEFNLEDEGDPASKLGDLYALLEDPRADREIKQAAGDAIRIIETWLRNVQEGMGISRQLPGAVGGLPSLSGGSEIRAGIDGTPRDIPQAQRRVVRTGTEPGTGRRVVQYDDGSTAYAD